LLRRTLVPALAERGIRPQPVDDVEVHAEPVGILLENRADRRFQPALDPDGVHPVVVACSQLEEEVLLRREPVEDGATGETDLLFELDDRRAFVAVAGEAAACAGENPLAALLLGLLRDLRHGRTLQNSTYVLLSCDRGGRSSDRGVREAPRRGV